MRQGTEYNEALVLEVFDLLFDERNFAVAEKCRCCEHISPLQCRRASSFRHEFTDHKGEPKPLAKST